MFAFIRDAWERRTRSKIRFVFRYWNGSNRVFGDPMELYRALQSHPDYSESNLSLLGQEAIQNQIIGELATVVRDVFKIPQLAEGGLTELECVQVLGEFIAYCGFQKKSGVQMPTSPETTEPSSQSSVPETSTNAVSDST